MEINKDEMAAKAAEVTGQAKELLSKVDTKKALNATDKFMAGVFKFGKVIAALFMLACIATMALSLVYYVFAGANSLDVPKFSDIESQLNSSGREKQNVEPANKDAKTVRSKFSSKIEQIIDLYRLDSNSDFGDIVDHLCLMDEDYRSSFVNGAISFGRDYKKYVQRENKEFKGPECFGIYKQLFRHAVSEASESQDESKANRQGALMVCGGALLGLILFLIIPLLIQIEETVRRLEANTRK